MPYNFFVGILYLHWDFFNMLTWKFSRHFPPTNLQLCTFVCSDYIWKCKSAHVWSNNRRGFSIRIAKRAYIFKLKLLDRIKGKYKRKFHNLLVKKKTNCTLTYSWNHTWPQQNYDWRVVDDVAMNRVVCKRLGLSSIYISSQSSLYFLCQFCFN